MKTYRFPLFLLVAFLGLYLASSVYLTRTNNLSPLLFPSTCAFGCPGPPTKSRIDAWQQGSGPEATNVLKIKVFIDPMTFTSSQQDAIKVVLTNFNNKNSLTGTCSYVKFDLTTTNVPVGTGAYTLNILHVNGKTLQEGQAEEEGGATGGVKVRSIIRIDDRVTFADAIKKSIGHELGHTYGLADCPRPYCPFNATSSVMNLAGVDNSTGAPIFNDTTNGRPDLASCDISQIRLVGNYKCLAAPSGGTGNPTPCSTFYPVDFRVYPQTGCGAGFTASSSGYCCSNSPIAFDITGQGFHFTDVPNGVNFDSGGDGYLDRMAWPDATYGNGWLVYDRNHNGIIDSGIEMFGNFTEQPPAAEPNGFLALAVYDSTENGGNGDGKIDNSDAIWPSLRIWQDADVNGVTDPGELKSLTSLGITSISLSYITQQTYDLYGNQFRYRASVTVASGSTVRPYCYDVYPVTNP